ncbi:MAG: PEGA domain-containing protein [Calditrichaeota bacterium]|nr:PEGA domain-containing protein [Calditrichota bacterium]
MRVGRLIVCVALLALCAAAGAQERPLAVQRGIDLFYQARFAEASDVLQQAIATGKLAREARFDAYLYLAFAILRGGGPAEAADVAFEACVRTDPARTLDPSRIPPDLVERFEQVRRGLVGRLYVVSNPREAGVFGVQAETGRQIVGRTPVLFENLLAGSYQLRITKEGYGQEVLAIEVDPSEVDTLYVDLREGSSKASTRRWIVGTAIAASLLAVVIVVAQRAAAP